jgi:hypothetical protein
MNYQDAIERAIALRLRAKKEADATRKQTLLALAQEWERWADTCREASVSGAALDPAGMPSENI